MKNILNTINRNEIVNRINNLNPSNQAIWGKMNVNEMLCHITDSIKMAMGTKPTEYIGNKISSSLLKNLILLGMPAPKGKAETVKELKQGAGGTTPTDFLEDKNMLLKLINNFNECYKDGMITKHPAFGDLNKKQWSRLTYVHLNHHLKQFGV